MIGGVLAGYRRFLAIPGARRLLFSAVLTRTPNGMLSLSVVLLIRAQTGSFALAGVAVGAYALANGAMSPVQGMLVDRLGQPRVLAGAATAQSLVLGVLVAAAQLGARAAALIALVALAGALVPPSMACARALWPVITPDAATRDAAYALDAIILEAAWVLGPPIVVAVVALSSTSAAVLLCAAITLAGTAGLAGSPHARAWRPRHAERPRAGAIASARLRRLLASVALVGFWWGGLQVAFPALAVHAHARESAGVMLGFVSLGGVIGGLAYGARRWRAAVDARYATLLAVMGLTLVPLVIVQSVGAAIPLSLVAGLAMTPALSCQNTLAALTAPAGAVTEAFTWTTAAMWGGIAGGSAAGGALVEAAGLRAPFVAGTAALALGALLAALPAWRARPGRSATPAPMHADA